MEGRMKYLVKTDNEAKSICLGTRQGGKNGGNLLMNSEGNRGELDTAAPTHVSKETVVVGSNTAHK